jgi:hypothetical protein
MTIVYCENEEEVHLKEISTVTEVRGYGAFDQDPGSGGG